MMTARRTGTTSIAALLAVSLVALGIDASQKIDDARDDARQHEADAGALEAQRVRLRREYEAAGRVAARVIAGTLPLAGAVDEMEPVLRERPGFECAWPDDPPPTPRHRVARSVMIRVAGDLELDDPGDPARRAAVLARLDAEYAALR